jgi:TonB family protein
MIRLFVVGAMALLVATATAGEKEKLAAFHTSVRVDVDASGKPVAVRAPEELPGIVREALERRVAGWSYEPAIRDGVQVASTTFVYVGVCARPDGDGLRLGVDYKANGPRLMTRLHRMPPPAYPDDAVRAGAEGRFLVNYEVRPDGSTRFISLEAEEGKRLRGGQRKTFEGALMAWVEGLRYEPERVDGMAVSTQQRVPVIFSLGGRSLPDLPSRAETREECREAGAAGGLMPVAIDSPVKVTPMPAG